VIAAEIRWQWRHGASAHRDEFAMLAACWTGTRKERRERLALRLIEALALRQHAGLGVAELRWWTSSRLGRVLPLEFFVELSHGTFRHATLLHLAH
jgi:hypothetical protein